MLPRLSCSLASACFPLRGHAGKGCLAGDVSVEMPSSQTSGKRLARSPRASRSGQSRGRGEFSTQGGAGSPVGPGAEGAVLPKQPFVPPTVGSEGGLQGAQTYRLASVGGAEECT